MKFIAICFSAVHGLLAVGALALLQEVVRAFQPSWSLPFDVWWGLVLAIPGLAVSFAMGRMR